MCVQELPCQQKQPGTVRDLSCTRRGCQHSAHPSLPPLLPARHLREMLGCLKWPLHLWACGLYPWTSVSPDAGSTGALWTDFPFYSSILLWTQPCREKLRSPGSPVMTTVSREPSPCAGGAPRSFSGHPILGMHLGTGSSLATFFPHRVFPSLLSPAMAIDVTRLSKSGARSPFPDSSVT